MEIATSAITGSMRLVLQIVSFHKRPVVEVYQQLRNRIGPEEELEGPDGVRLKTRLKHDFTIDLTLINIGSVKAENVRLTLEPDFTLIWPAGFKLSSLSAFQCPIRQLSPGESVYLCQFYHQNVYKSLDKGAPPQDPFTITITFDGPNQGINWLVRKVKRLRHKHQYQTTFTFEPSLYANIMVPPAEYA